MEGGCLGRAGEIHPETLAARLFADHQLQHATKPASPMKARLSERKSRAQKSEK